MFTDQAILAPSVSINHQFFIQNFYGSNGFFIGKFGGSGNGMPVTSQEFTAWRATAHFGHQNIFFVCQHKLASGGQPRRSGFNFNRSSRSTAPLRSIDRFAISVQKRFELLERFERIERAKLSPFLPCAFFPIPNFLLCDHCALCAEYFYALATLSPTAFLFLIEHLLVAELLQHF